MTLPYPFRTLCLAVVAALFTAIPMVRAEDKVIRIGILGCDTSHVPAFTKLFNDPKAEGVLAGFKIVAAFPGGSKDIESSHTRVPKYVEEIQKLGVEPLDSIQKVLDKVDVVCIESVDGRPHLEEARLTIAAKKPFYVDKPLAGSLADAIAIAELAKKNNVPFFSSSSLRFGPAIQAMKKDAKVGGVLGVDAFSPCSLNEHHPDLYWYGVHGCEILYTLMGPGCEKVTRINAPNVDVAVGVWGDGRVGTFRGTREGKHDYGALVFGKKAVVAQIGFEGYKPLVEEIAKFFKSGKPPVAADETVEIMAFMEAADESKRQGGIPVKMADVMAKAKAAAQQKLAQK